MLAHVIVDAYQYFQSIAVKHRGDPDFEERVAMRMQIPAKPQERQEPAAEALAAADLFWTFDADQSSPSALDFQEDDDVSIAPNPTSADYPLTSMENVYASQEQKAA